MLKSSEENVKTCQFEFKNVVPLICNGSDLGYFCLSKTIQFNS